MKTQGNQSWQGQCQQCKQRSPIIDLNCGHGFCLRCLTFGYHKNKLNVNRISQTRCIRCEKTVELREDELRSINQFTDQVLVPLMREEQDRKEARTQTQDVNAAGKQYKTHQKSIQKLTPIGGRGFYSKCDSPKNQLPQAYCSIHPDQQLSVVCLTCQYALLCIACTAGKKHGSHVLKTLPKGLECVHEQLALAKLKSRQNIDHLQIIKRRTDDRRVVIQKRWDEATASLKNNFASLIDCISRKQEEIVHSCNEQFQGWMDEVVRDNSRIEEALKHARRKIQKLADANSMTGNSADIIKKSMHLVEEIIDFRQPDLQCTDIFVAGEWDVVIRAVQHITESVEAITPLLQYQYRGGIKASRSEQKLLKENQCKRVKTNMISLNSSRQRKQKKYTKTEQDQKRNKSKANYKTESTSKVSKVNKAYPAYLLQHLQKNQLPESFADINPLTSSFKSTKLLSKSHLPAEDIKRKKEHVAMIKQRLQRKTFNGSAKQHRVTTEAMRKKKIPY